jgi:hypothetical protein
MGGYSFCCNCAGAQEGSSRQNETFSFFLSRSLYTQLFRRLELLNSCHLYALFFAASVQFAGDRDSCIYYPFSEIIEPSDTLGSSENAEHVQEILYCSVHLKERKK